MTSFRTKAATRLVLALGVKRRLQELADSYGDPVEFERLIDKTRRYDRREPPSRIARRLEHEQIDVQGHDLHIISAPSRPDRRLILYLHGGGYMFGPFGAEWKMAWSLAVETDSDLAMFLYPRTPEHQVDHTVKVALQAYQALLDRYASEIVLVGTSAGGGLGVTLMVEANKTAMRLPSRVVILSPAVDMTLRDDLKGLGERDVFLSADYVRLAGRLYAGSLEAGHPLVSPTRGTLECLPPLQILAGSQEILRPSIETFAERVRLAGSSVDLRVGIGQQHAWPTLPTPEGQRARKSISDFILSERR